MQTTPHIRLGKPDVSISKPTHVPGVHEGNATSNIKRAVGHTLKGAMLKALARRSTGINPDGVSPIDPRSPHLTPP